jgi:hypothetical protein
VQPDVVTRSMFAAATGEHLAGISNIEHRTACPIKPAPGRSHPLGRSASGCRIHAVEMRRSRIGRLRTSWTNAFAPNARSVRAEDMQWDPDTGEMLYSLREWQEALRSAPPIVRKAWVYPDQLTAEEKKELMLQVISTMTDHLPEDDIRTLIAESAVPNKPHAAVVCELLQGKLAARELGVARGPDSLVGLPHPKTGKPLTAADIVQAQEEYRAFFRAKRTAVVKKAATKKARATAQRKRPGKL